METKTIYILCIFTICVLGACTSSVLQTSAQSQKMQELEEHIAELKREIYVSEESLRIGVLHDQTQYVLREEHQYEFPTEEASREYDGFHDVMMEMLVSAAEEETLALRMIELHAYLEKLAAEAKEDLFQHRAYIQALHLVSSRPARTRIDKELEAYSSQVGLAETRALRAFFAWIWEEEFPKYWRGLTPEEQKNLDPSIEQISKYFEENEKQKVKENKERIEELEKEIEALRAAEGEGD